MAARYHNPEVALDPGGRSLTARFRLENRSLSAWRPQDGFCLGWQLFDPETGVFIDEGEWTKPPGELAPGSAAVFTVEVRLPPERGRYHVFISPRQEELGWFYKQGWPFLLIEARVEAERAELLDTRVTSLVRLRRSNFARSLRRALFYPVLTIWCNWPLIRSMTRRDITARYRGSFGDVLWTVLNPLLLMTTYFFVFGIVFRARFAGDPSRAGFALYFLAGMLPWLPFSEAVARAPSVILEHRNIVKKLVFPVETLPVNQVIAGIVTQAFASVVFLVLLLLVRGAIPGSVVWLPLLLVPQLLFTLGVSWFLAALGVFVRDLGQVMGFLLTLWFFLTPICYPEASLPPESVPILSKNPLYVLVRAYREVLLEGHAPSFPGLWKLFLLAAIVFIAGHAWFYKLRKSFPDVV